MQGARRLRPRRTLRIMPRGRMLDSRPSRAIVRCVQVGFPTGLRRATDSRSCSSGLSREPRMTVKQVYLGFVQCSSIGNHVCHPPPCAACPSGARPPQQHHGSASERPINSSEHHRRPLTSLRSSSFHRRAGITGSYRPGFGGRRLTPDPARGEAYSPFDLRDPTLCFRKGWGTPGTWTGHPDGAPGVALRAGDAIDAGRFSRRPR